MIEEAGGVFALPQGSQWWRGSSRNTSRQSVMDSPTSLTADVKLSGWTKATWKTWKLVCSLPSLQRGIPPNRCARDYLSGAQFAASRLCAESCDRLSPVARHPPPKIHRYRPGPCVLKCLAAADTKCGTTAKSPSRLDVAATQHHLGPKGLLLVAWIGRASSRLYR